MTSGDNGSFAAGPGWDACTGLGSPDGTALLEPAAADLMRSQPRYWKDARWKDARAPTRDVEEQIP